ncbi:MAG: hypothetical protein V5A38_01550 [Halolamina sp.]|uniref:hypothetical protein n=1 Tax=Halolamina sp. TaxID=1940283 RepID=UPI002FC2ADE8
MSAARKLSGVEKTEPPWRTRFKPPVTAAPRCRLEALRFDLSVRNDALEYVHTGGDGGLGRGVVDAGAVDELVAVELFGENLPELCREVVGGVGGFALRDGRA